MTSEAGAPAGSVVTAYIARWRPSAVPEPAASFARDVVAQAAAGKAGW